MGVAPARIFRRYTQTAGKHYMAFTCPHCNATCGDMFVANEFKSHYVANRSTEATVAPTAWPQPHWCLAGDDGTCPIPPDSVIEELSRIDTSESGGAQAPATITPVGVPGGMSIHQAVSRMFGGY